MFVIPFIFAFYPELLLIDQALIDPSSPGKEFLPGYEDGVTVIALLWLLARLIFALYLIASALSRYDTGPLSMPWVLIRLAVAATVLAKAETIYLAAIAVGVGLLIVHRVMNRQSIAA